MGLTASYLYRYVATPTMNISLQVMDIMFFLLKITDHITTLHVYNLIC